MLCVCIYITCCMLTEYIYRHIYLYIMADIPFSIHGFPYSKPEYLYCADENRVYISYNEDYEIILDIKDHIDILNCGKKFVLHNINGILSVNEIH